MCTMRKSWALGHLFLFHVGSGIQSTFRAPSSMRGRFEPIRTRCPLLHPVLRQGYTGPSPPGSDPSPNRQATSHSNCSEQRTTDPPFHTYTHAHTHTHTHTSTHAHTPPTHTTLYAVRATDRVPAGSCHFPCSTDPSQSVVSFPCVQK